MKGEEGEMKRVFVGFCLGDSHLSSFDGGRGAPVGDMFQMQERRRKKEKEKKTKTATAKEKKA